MRMEISSSVSRRHNADRGVLLPDGTAMAVLQVVHVSRAGYPHTTDDGGRRSPHASPPGRQQHRAANLLWAIPRRNLQHPFAYAPKHAGPPAGIDRWLRCGGILLRNKTRADVIPETFL
ncbi:MAG: hypothetical protein CL858_06105 [Cupriavidus sp.]|nr:hypothetical protein [Cupriavidus sp.]